MSFPLFHKDKMTEEERSQALMMGEPIDRVPFHLLALGFQAVNVGSTINDFYRNMKIAYDSGRMTSEQYGAMWIPFGGYPALGPWELGGKVSWPTGEFSQCPNVEEPVTTEEEAWALELPRPETLKTLGFIPDHLEIARLTKSDGVPFCVPLYCPWTTAGNIVGIDKLCKWTMRKPDLAHHVVRYATDFLVEFLKLVVDITGPQNFFPMDSTASAASNLISPKTFKEFALPYMIEYHEKIIANGIAMHRFPPLWGTEPQL